MAVNPNGYVNIADGGTPRILTGYAMEVISGGQLVGASGAANVVSSGTDSFVTSDITLYHTLGSGNFVGVALHDAASGAPLSVATRGQFILESSGITLAGLNVACNNLDEVFNCLNESSGADIFISIGRALTCGSDGGYVIVDIHG